MNDKKYYKIENIKLYYKEKSKHEFVFLNHLYIEDEMSLNKEEIFFKYIFESLFNNISKEDITLAGCTINKKIENTILRYSKDNYSFRFYITLKSIDELRTNQEKFIKSIKALNLPFFNTCTFEQNHLSIDVCLVFNLKGKDLKYFFNNMCDMQNTILDFLENDFIETANDSILLINRNYYSLNEIINSIDEKEYRKQMIKCTFS